MKSALAVLAVGFALSMCHLTSRMTNTNVHSNNNNNSMSSSTPSREFQPAPPPGVTQNNSAKTSRTISGGVLNGNATSLPPPGYPAIAKTAHASGTVTVQVLVDEEGKVVTAHAVSGHPLLQAAAVAAARQARFTPTKLSGQPVKVTGVIVYNFRAQ